LHRQAMPLLTVFLFSLLHLYYVMSCTYIFFISCYTSTRPPGRTGHLQCAFELTGTVFSLSPPGRTGHLQCAFELTGTVFSLSVFFSLLPIAKTGCQEAPAAGHSIFFFLSPVGSGHCSADGSTLFFWPLLCSAKWNPAGSPAGMRVPSGGRVAVGLGADVGGTTG
jgi:hypothetical protein